jgi:hypothetical protein
MHLDMNLVADSMDSALMGVVPLLAIVAISLLVAGILKVAKGDFARNFGVVLAFGTVGAGLGLFIGESGIEVAKLTLPIILTAIVGYLAWTLKIEPPPVEGEQPPSMTAVKLMFMAAPTEIGARADGETPPEQLDVGRVVLACVILIWGMIGGLYWGETLQAHQTRILLVAAQDREDAVRDATSLAARETAADTATAARVLAWMEHVLAPIAVKAAGASVPAPEQQ